MSRGGDNTTPYNAVDPTGWNGNRPEYSDREDTVTLADFTIAPREHLCPECWQIHRPEVECP